METVLISTSTTASTKTKCFTEGSTQAKIVVVRGTWRFDHWAIRHSVIRQSQSTKDLLRTKILHALSKFYYMTTKLHDNDMGPQTFCSA